MSKILLAEGQITPSDSLVIELIESIDTPPAVLLRWPGGPFFTQPHRLPAVANQIMAIMAAAIARLATVERDY